MNVEVGAAAAESTAADLLAVALMPTPSALVRRLDERLGGRLLRLVETGEASARAGRALVLYLDGELPAARLVIVGVDAPGAVDEDSVRTAAATAVRAAAGIGGTIAWAFDGDLRLAPDRQAVAVVEGALLGAYDPGRWKTTPRPAGPERLVLAGADAALAEPATRAAVVARWTNRARELVDAPPNELTPAGLAAAAAELLAPQGVRVETLGPAEIEALGLTALAAVGGGSRNEPRLVALRWGEGERTLGLVGKGVTFDSGGYFLKPQPEIVKQKADMGGAAAVVGAVGAIAELGLRAPILAVLPAVENALDGGAYRPGDVVRTACGLTVEITNPDAEGRLIMADALWYAARNGATHLVDVATLTGAMRAALGDVYLGVFANDDHWRDELVAAGNASGDHAWPWPLHRRYGQLLESSVADLRQTSGRAFGYPIFAAALLARFADGRPWAHLDIHSVAWLDEDRDYLARGASGAGVRLLTELARRF